MGEHMRLPPEVTEEILIRLPVKSLTRFRCVSKSWHSLISDQTFVRKHLNLSLLQKPTSLVLINPVTRDNEKFCVFHLPSLERIPNINKLCLPLGTSYWKLVASCHGLLCIHVYESIYIWNPCVTSNSNYCRLIPNTTGTQHCDYGLGYDSERDDYKLLRVSITATAQTEVYSLKNSCESWKKLDDFPQGYFPCGGTAFLNGSIHWLAFRPDLGPNNFALFSFDLSDKKYKATTLPELFSPIPSSYVYAHLYVLKGMLCVLTALNPCIVLWAMKDVSNPKSWIKILDIRIEQAFDWDCPNVTPFYLYENDQVLMGILSHHGTELLVCKHNIVLFRHIVFWEQCLIPSGFIHVDSLISPMPIHRNRVKA